ncbi:MAG: DUF4382 domain-containing protein [Acidobacteriota bacterium]|nr:DUF4382 domain-containing protein [Acidobacteriota bacterium]
MQSQLKAKAIALPLALLSLGAVLVAGCSSGSAGISANAANTGSSFVIGTDAPMASVTSFSVQIQSITATDANGNSVSLLSGTPTVDFARFNGLQTLLDMNNVAAGTYTNVTINLGAATLGYLDTTTAEPTIQTEAATLTSSSVSVALTKPLVVSVNGAPAGLRIDFNLHKSIQVDSNGQITGVVDPTFAINGVSNTDSGAYIDEFVGAVVSVNSSGQSFVVQGPHGHQFTVNVDSNTQWDGKGSISDLTTSSIVTFSGKLDRAASTIDADEVAIVSQDGFYAGGLVTYVNTATGPATSFDLYVRGLLPTTTGLQLGQIGKVDLSGSETFSIYWMNNPLTQYLFNQSALVAGQHLAIGGPASGAANASAVTVNRVMLRASGINGTIVPGSINTTNGSFQIQVSGFAGVLIPQTVTVYVTGKTEWRDGFSDLSNLADNDKVRVVGLLLKNTTNGNTILIGRYCDDMIDN